MCVPIVLVSAWVGHPTPNSILPQRGRDPPEPDRALISGVSPLALGGPPPAWVSNLLLIRSGSGAGKLGSVDTHCEGSSVQGEQHRIERQPRDRLMRMRSVEPRNKIAGTRRYAVPFPARMRDCQQCTFVFVHGRPLLARLQDSVVI